MKFYLFDYYLSNLVICIAPIFHGWLLFCLNFKKARRQVQKRSTPKLKALRDSKDILNLPFKFSRSEFILDVIPKNHETNLVKRHILNAVKVDTDASENVLNFPFPLHAQTNHWLTAFMDIQVGKVIKSEVA